MEHDHGVRRFRQVAGEGRQAGTAARRADGDPELLENRVREFYETIDDHAGGLAD
jgi:hypothetical protein